MFLLNVNALWNVWFNYVLFLIFRRQVEGFDLKLENILQIWFLENWNHFIPNYT